MQPDDIPPEVVRFITAHIDSVPQLEALLLLWESSPRSWTREELAARLYVDLATAEQITSDLRRRGLVGTANSPNDFTFLREAEAASAVALVAQTYRRHLIPISRLIHAKGSPAMQEFARAFQFKNER